VLVEGLTEKLVLPFVFSALGYDVDREAISIVECGGKPNIPLFATSAAPSGSVRRRPRQRPARERQVRSRRERAERPDRRHCR
jgi:hypothetical protein